MAVIKATELKDGDVTQVSLVKCPANEEPIKIIKAKDAPEKGDTDLLKSILKTNAPIGDDIGRIVVLEKNEESTDTMVGTLNRKFDKTKENGKVVYKFIDDDSEFGLIPTAEGEYITTSKFYNYWNHEDFESFLATNGVNTLIDLYCHLYAEFFRDCFYCSDTKDDFIAKITAGIESLREFVVSSAESIPEISYEVVASAAKAEGAKKTLAKDNQSLYNKDANKPGEVIMNEQYITAIKETLSETGIAKLEKAIADKTPIAAFNKSLEEGDYAPEAPAQEVTPEAGATPAVEAAPSATPAAPAVDPAVDPAVETEAKTEKALTAEDVAAIVSKALEGVTETIETKVASAVKSVETTPEGDAVPAVEAKPDAQVSKFSRSRDTARERRLPKKDQATT